MGACATPVAGVVYTRNCHELVSWFPDDAAYSRYLEWLRCGQGVSRRLSGDRAGE